MLKRVEIVLEPAKLLHYLSQSCISIVAAADMQKQQGVPTARATSLIEHKFRHMSITLLTFI
jgi:hypothetical protein